MNEAFKAKPLGSYRMIWHRNISVVKLNEQGDAHTTSKFIKCSTDMIVRYNPLKGASVERMEIDWIMSILDEVKAEIEILETEPVETDH